MENTTRKNSFFSQATMDMAQEWLAVNEPNLTEEEYEARLQAVCAEIEEGESFVPAPIRFTT